STDGVGVAAREVAAAVPALEAGAGAVDAACVLEAAAPELACSHVVADAPASTTDASITAWHNGTGMTRGRLIAPPSHPPREGLPREPGPKGVPAHRPGPERPWTRGAEAARGARSARGSRSRVRWGSARSPSRGRRGRTRSAPGPPARAGSGCRRWAPSAVAAREAGAGHSLRRAANVRDRA